MEVDFEGGSGRLYCSVDGWWEGVKNRSDQVPRFLLHPLREREVPEEEKGVCSVGLGFRC